MKRYFGMIIGIVVFFVAVGVAYNKYKTTKIEADKEVDAARIKAEYLERVGWLRVNPDEKAYKDEIGTFLRWYFKEINEHQNRYGGNHEFDAYLGELDQRKKGGKDAEVDRKKAYYDYAKNVFDVMRTGKYAPIFSATDKGMRFDLMSSDAKPAPGGKRQVQLALVLWGAQRELREDGKQKKMATSVSFHFNWKLFDEKGKLFGEMNGDGDPAMKIDWPERFIEEFPPQTVLGYFEMPPVPAQVAKMEMNFNVNSRSPSGGDALATYTWKLDTPAEWKLGVGEKWEGAEESVRPEEEIDPALAAKHGQARK